MMNLPDEVFNNILLCVWVLWQHCECKKDEKETIQAQRVMFSHIDWLTGHDSGLENLLFMCI